MSIDMETGSVASLLPDPFVYISPPAPEELHYGKASGGDLLYSAPKGVLTIGDRRQE